MCISLRFRFKNEDLNISLNRKELEVFSEESNFLTKGSEVWEIDNSFFSNSSVVPNVFRYVLKFTEEKGWFFLDSNSNFIDRFNPVNDKEKIPTETGKNIILLLESPHRDEYDLVKGELTPKGPAYGTSGNFFYNYFTSHVLPILSSLGLELNKETEYCICIVNPVPYQASLGSIYKGALVASIRDSVWKSIYSRIKNEFLDTLREYKPFLILNGCTSNLKKELEPELKLINCSVYNVSHPSSWQRTFGGFKQRF